jgi:hypothetical protein
VKSKLDTNRMMLLSKAHSRALRRYELLLEASGLSPSLILGAAGEDPEAVLPWLRSMTEQVVRSEVVLEYTTIDMGLSDMITRHFFGSGRRQRKATSSRRRRTLRLMLQNIYLLQKLAVVRSFKDVPRPIVSKIAAINDVRNGLAHSFFLRDLPASKRKYKGFSIFDPRGLRAFRKDAWEVQCFFTPWLREAFEEADVGLTPSAPDRG